MSKFTLYPKVPLHIVNAKPVLEKKLGSSAPFEYWSAFATDKNSVRIQCFGKILSGKKNFKSNCKRHIY